MPLSKYILLPPAPDPVKFMSMSAVLSKVPPLTYKLRQLSAEVPVVDTTMSLLLVFCTPKCPQGLSVG